MILGYANAVMAVKRKTTNAVHGENSFWFPEQL